jgi:hypothetical protein
MISLVIVVESDEFHEKVGVEYVMFGEKVVVERFSEYLCNCSNVSNTIAKIEILNYFNLE